MKPKIRLITLVIAFFASWLPAKASDKSPTFSYEAEVAGVMCSACSSKVKAAFEKLDGVTKVKVKASKEPAVAKVEFTSSSATLTQAAAIKALGADASSYQVRALTKKD